MTIVTGKLKRIRVNTYLIESNALLSEYNKSLGHTYKNAADVKKSHDKNKHAKRSEAATPAGIA